MESNHIVTVPLAFSGGAAGECAGYLFDPAQPGRVAIGFGEADFYVALICRKVAKATIVANHYSRRVYNGSTLHLGVWVGGRMLAVPQYCYAMNPASAGSVIEGTELNQYLELNRMWRGEAIRPTRHDTGRRSRQPR